MQNVPNSRGHFGQFGGKYVAETLMPALFELESAYKQARGEPKIRAQPHRPPHVMELKSIEDWVVEKNLKAVPNIVDVATFGGPTREYQVRVDPNKLISYGLSLAQVEQQLTNNNVNAGGSFVEAGLQQINVREVGLVGN